MANSEGETGDRDANDGVDPQHPRQDPEMAGDDDGPLLAVRWPLPPLPSFEDYVSEQLANLGLDGDTYAPYVLPLFGNDQDDDPDLLEDEWETVLSLLRESADADNEGGSDDDHGSDATGTAGNDQWAAFRSSVEHAWKVQKEHEADVDRRERARHNEQVQAQIERERRVALEAAAADAGNVIGDSSKAGKALSEEEERERRALVERFAYENDDDGEDGFSNNGSNEPEMLSNRQAAALAAMEKQQQLRSKGPAATTKKEERQKTAQSRKEKEEKKDDRRKRATKGERRR